MAAQTEKTTKPPYVSFTTFTNALNRLRDIGVPSRIDASVFPGQSGSGVAALLGAFRYLKLVDDAGNPEQSFRQLVDAKDENRGSVLKPILQDRYDFITRGDVDLKSASSRQVEEAFRKQGIEGSTVTKSVSFFLAAAQLAGMSTSPHVKPPKPPRSNGGSKRKRAAEMPAPASPTATPADAGLSGKERIAVSVHGMDDWVIFVPKGLNAAQWKHGLKMAMFILSNYRPDETLAPEKSGEEANG